MQRLIERADADKLKKAVERLSSWKNRAQLISKYFLLLLPSSVLLNKVGRDLLSFLNFGGWQMLRKVGRATNNISQKLLDFWVETGLDSSIRSDAGGTEAGRRRNLNHRSRTSAIELYCDFSHHLCDTSVLYPYY